MASPICTDEPSAVVVERKVHLNYGILIASETADRLGLVPVDGVLVTQFSMPPTGAARDAINAERKAVFPGIPRLEVIDDPVVKARVENWSILGLLFIVALLASAVAIQLSRIFTLRSVGASHRAIRLASAPHIGIISAIGSVVDVVAGLAPAHCIVSVRQMFFRSSYVPFTPPWE